MDKWRLALDEALIASGLDCTSDSEPPEKALARLISWEKAMVLDPKISSAAASLVARGKQQQKKPEERWICLRCKSTKKGYHSLGCPEFEMTRHD